MARYQLRFPKARRVTTTSPLDETHTPEIVACLILAFATVPRMITAPLRANIHRASAAFPAGIVEF